MPVTELIAEGKTKILKPGNAPDELVVQFKDAATAFNGQKYQEIPGKGALNAQISQWLFERLEQEGIPTCYLRAGDNPNTLIYKRLTMIPLEVVVRNHAYGSVVKRYHLAEGSPFPQPVVEFFHKTNDDPLISEDLILSLHLVPNAAILKQIKHLALQINEIFCRIFEARNIRCADFKLEFGLDTQGKLLLGDELSPDNFRLRDIHTEAVLDKDLFRLDLGNITETYQHLLSRLQESVSEKSQVSKTYTGEVFVYSRKNILNPESKAILEGVHTLGHHWIQSLSAGKRFVLTLQATSLLQAEQQLKQLAETVLSNPVIEDYEVSVQA